MPRKKRRSYHRLARSNHQPAPLIDDVQGAFAPAAPLILLWMLRILMSFRGIEELLKHVSEYDYRSWSNEYLAILRSTGMEHWGAEHQADPDLREERAASRRRTINFRAEMQIRHRDAEQASDEAWDALKQSALHHNVRKIEKLVGLSETDCRLLIFTTLVRSVEVLKETTEIIGHLSKVKTHEVLSKLLDVPVREIRASLDPKSILHRSGLLLLDKDRGRLEDKLEVLSDAFIEEIAAPDMDTADLLRGMVSPGEAPKLKLDDYGYVAKSLQVLRPYLKRAIEKRKRGVNIFIYGAPGTGKTQLVRVLAAELGRGSYEVASGDNDDDPIGDDGRLRAYRVAQYFFAKRKALLMFDEAEDVFPSHAHHPFFSVFTSSGRTVQKSKGWINRMLEENALPTFWVSNSISGIDPAYIRRFDMVMELPVPPKRTREQIIRNACGKLLEPSAVARIAESKVLAPAVITRATEVVNLIRDDLEPSTIEPAFELLINNTLEAQRHHPIKRHDPNRLPEIYDPAFIHADRELAPLADALVNAKAGRLCMYGPPGTGKTAYGRWISERMDVPLLLRRASDLLSKYVGEVEKNIAEAFREAEREGALLLIDEVDSFLQDRRGAKNSWEVTQVNEMLTQMESFSGVFIASTNLVDGLDQASLRRFDLKIKFDFLRPEQAWALLAKHCTALQLTPPDEDLKMRLARLLNLTPGDFASVVRQSALRTMDSAEALIAELETECALKEGVKSPIGFGG